MRFLVTTRNRFFFMPIISINIKSILLYKIKEMYKLILGTVLCVLALNLNGQWNNVPVYPDLDGQDLLEAVIETYKLDNPLEDQRDTLFAKIDNVNGILTCIYTNYSITLDPNLDPTQDAFAKGINTEHSFPKSKGSGGHSGEYDMHHLFPSREDVNNYRASKPYKNIPDNETQRWYYLDQQISNIPNNNIDEYSEGTGDFFEPREDMKGNVARASFYFYTLYKEEADAADQGYFQSMLETLCTWHYEDPVDQQEWLRNIKIAKYQELIPNPFVLDCSLAGRIYCGEISAECMLVPNVEITKASSTSMRYDMVNQSLIFETENHQSGTLYIYNNIGQLIENIKFSTITGINKIPLIKLKDNQIYNLIWQSYDDETISLRIIK